MKSQSVIGIILIVVAIVAFAYQGITYTTREKAVDLGPIQITAERTHIIPVPPIVGAVALVGGSCCWWLHGKKPDQTCLQIIMAPEFLLVGGCFHGCYWFGLVWGEMKTCGGENRIATRVIARMSRKIEHVCGCDQAGPGQTL